MFADIQKKLGFGCMRLPQTAGIINKAEAEKQIMAAYNAGVNYFDTAYIYPGSESAIGEILFPYLSNL